MESNYSAKDMLDDLKKEVQKRSEALAKLWPERIQRYSHRQLSELWGKNPQYANHATYKSKRNPNYRISRKNLRELVEKVKTKLGSNSLGCEKIINSYEKKELKTDEFIKNIETELGKVSGDVPLTNCELSKIITGKEETIVSLYSHKFNPNAIKYDPEFIFSKERLIEMEENIKNNLCEFDAKLEKPFQKYKIINPDLPDYTGEKYELKNPHFFSEINTSEKCYWFGYMCADGWLTSAHKDKYDQIGFSQSSKDKERVKLFAKAIGLDPNYRIDERERDLSILEYESKQYLATEMRFQCKPMSDDLKRHGFLEFKKNLKDLPKAVKICIEKGKKQAKEKKNLKWLYTTNGKNACAWLLGFYDGDGTYKGGRTGIIYSSSKELLMNIKNHYEIPNSPYKNSERKKKNSDGTKSIMYGLTVGPKIFEAMMNSYKNSMKRKRGKKLT